MERAGRAGAGMRSTDGADSPAAAPGHSRERLRRQLRSAPAWHGSKSSQRPKPVAAKVCFPGIAAVPGKGAVTALLVCAFAALKGARTAG